MTREAAPGASWDVVTLGETMALARTDSVGPLAHAPELKLGVGGAESNVAIGLSRLGRKVAWIGRVGDDSLGQLVARELRAEAIGVFAVVDSEAPTGLMIKERRTPNSQQVWYYRAGSAGSRLAVEDLPTAVLDHAQILHVTGITLALSPTAVGAVHAAVDRAKRAGSVISFDVNYRSRLWRPDDAAASIQQLAAQADVVFAGEGEAELLTGAQAVPADQARAIAATGASQVIVKRGDAGCVAVIDGIEFAQDAVRVNAVDTVGAGDAFVAGYLAELSIGAPPARRLQTAVRTGAFACMSPGDWEGAARPQDLALLDATESVCR
jgi:2-dehydro-3-deoxygluconokinase